uniref:Uncharacterized protein n=1 Tax=Ciona intestinalis TaxID=7719 RepID=H2XQE8_CIOIN
TYWRLFYFFKLLDRIGQFYAEILFFNERNSNLPNLNYFQVCQQKKGQQRLFAQCLLSWWDSHCWSIVVCV